MLLSKLPFIVFLLLCIILPCTPEYFAENFESTQTYSTRWTISDAIQENQRGTFQRIQNKLTDTLDHGLQTTDSPRYYAISHPLKNELHNLGKTLIIQYSVRFEQTQEKICAGGYIKLLTSDFQPNSFDGDTNYAIMFGPDICGESKIQFYVRADQHASLSDNVDNSNNMYARQSESSTSDGTDRSSFIPTTLPMKRTIDYGISATERTRSHIFTLVIHGSDNSWEILIDDISLERGNMTNSFNFLPPLYVLDKTANIN